MNTWTSRLSAVLSFACIILSIVTAFNAGTHFFLKGDPHISVTQASLHKMGNFQLNALHNSGELGVDQHGVFVHFNLTADFSPAWTWNTHQIFVMVIAEYETPKYKSHISIWDKIISSKSDCKLNLVNEIPEYPITDYTADLANKVITLTVKYDVMPIAGPLFMDTSSNYQRFSLPSKVSSLPIEKFSRKFYAPNTRPF